MVCGGRGDVARRAARMGFRVGPVIEITVSRWYDILHDRTLEWLVWLARERRVKYWKMDPPCTTFSAAAFPPYRSTKIPLGFNPKEPKTRLGNQLAHACLFLLKVVWRMGDMGDLEQPFLSRMRWLPKYQSLLALPEVSFHKVASCAYGAPWQKYFGILAVRSDLSRLDAKCPGTCRHVVLQGALTGPSAVYWPALAEKWRTSPSRTHRIDLRTSEIKR